MVVAHTGAGHRFRGDDLGAINLLLDVVGAEPRDHRLLDSVGPRFEARNLIEPSSALGREADGCHVVAEALSHIAEEDPVAHLALAQRVDAAHHLESEDCDLIVPASNVVRVVLVVLENLALEDATVETAETTSLTRNLTLDRDGRRVARVDEVAAAIALLSESAAATTTIPLRLVGELALLVGARAVADDLGVFTLHPPVNAMLSRVHADAVRGQLLPGL